MQKKKPTNLWKGGEDCGAHILRSLHPQQRCLGLTKTQRHIALCETNIGPYS